MPNSPAHTFADAAIQRALGLRIVELRRERGWTQEDLIDRTGLDRSYLARIENGRTNPTLRTLSRIANGFQIGLADLFISSD